MKTLEASFLSLMSLSLIKNGILEFLFATLGYAQSALQKKSALLDSLIAMKPSLLDSLIASFVEQFKRKPRKH